ncbi:MAG TPA: helix-turn-helix transcriptional regulator [Longimicrobium sp.]|jgi:DNA-binding XRE family transcriptional regulator
MTFKRQGSRASEVFARLLEDTPGLAQAEKELGSKLVIAENVMRLRIQRGYTQKQLADALGVRQPRIAEIESARANLQVDTLDRLAEVFGVETASLFRVEKASPRRALKRRGSVGSRKPEDAKR